MTPGEVKAQCLIEYDYVVPNNSSGRKIMTQLPDGKTLTPKQALKKIQEVIPEVTVICRNTNVTLTSICYIGENSNIEWGDITEYQEPQYREPTLADLDLMNPKDCIFLPDHWNPSDAPEIEWPEGKLVGVLVTESMDGSYRWICKPDRDRMLSSNIQHVSKVRVRV